jgi:hypothetical protein
MAIQPDELPKESKSRSAPISPHQKEMALPPDQWAVSILQQLAQVNACATIDDPIASQQAIRADRPLPGRHD